MSSAAFELCSVQIDGAFRRIAKAKCGYCRTIQTIFNNTQAKTSGYDDDIIERRVVQKFERLGWKIGKSADQHRCPACYSKIKIAAVNKKKGTHMDKKVVPLTPSVQSHAEPPRTPTREEKRIIFAKIDEHYIDEKTGYSNSWNDKRISEDLHAFTSHILPPRQKGMGRHRCEDRSDTGESAHLEGERLHVGVEG